MKKHISYPSIEQFRNVVANVNRRYDFVGLNENGDAIYDGTKTKPTLTFKGTVKLHGTNAAVCLNKKSGMWYQSRENIITPESDNAGFAFFCESNKKHFMDLFAQIARHENLGYEYDVENVTLSIYGEWAGGNIQKNVGISNLPKSFFIFGVKVSPHTSNEEEQRANPAYWIPSHYLSSPEHRIYNIEDFPTWEMEIDFNTPETVQNILSELTLAVEAECPVAKAFGFSVWENNTAYEDEAGNIWFKNESFPNFTNPIKDKLKPIFKEKRIKHPKGVNFITFTLN
jgi:hypothetical protein